MPKELQEQLTDENGITQWATVDNLYYSLGLTEDGVAESVDALLANFPRFRKPRADEGPNHDYFRARAKLLQAWATCKKLVRRVKNTWINDTISKINQHNPVRLSDQSHNQSP